jgi:hypothetical protein
MVCHWDSLYLVALRTAAELVPTLEYVTDFVKATLNRKQNTEEKHLQEM